MSRKRKKAKLIAAVGQSYEHVKVPGSLYVVERVGPGVSEFRRECVNAHVTLITVVPAYPKIEEPGYKFTLITLGGDMQGLYYMRIG